MDDDAFRIQPAIMTIVNRLRRDGLDRDQAAAWLRQYEGLSERTREAVLSYFPAEADSDQPAG